MRCLKVNIECEITFSSTNDLGEFMNNIHKCFCKDKYIKLADLIPTDSNLFLQQIPMLQTISSRYDEMPAAIEIRGHAHVVGTMNLGEENKKVFNPLCPKCQGKGWYLVPEWVGDLQGRKDCNCEIKKENDVDDYGYVKTKKQIDGN